MVNPRLFSPSPSHLNSSTTSFTPSTPNTTHSASAIVGGSSFSFGMPRTSSPPNLDHYIRSAPVEGPPSSYYPPSKISHKPSTSLASISSTSSSAFSVLKPLRPLDYSALTSTEATHAELAKTIDDLARCLSVVETGLTGMLDTIYLRDAIEEEGEQEEGQEDETLYDTSVSHSGYGHGFETGEDESLSTEAVEGYFPGPGSGPGTMVNGHGRHGHGYHGHSYEGDHSLLVNS